MYSLKHKLFTRPEMLPHVQTQRDMGCHTTRSSI